MKRLNLHIVVSWALLAYFALFIVPPASTFASGGPTRPASREESNLVRDDHRAPVFLFDVILWEQLKTTKQSPEFAPAPAAAGLTGAANQHVATLPPALPFSGSFLPGRSFPFHPQSRSSAIRFFRSGVSPPSFSR